MQYVQIIPIIMKKKKCKKYYTRANSRTIQRRSNTRLNLCFRKKKCAEAKPIKRKIRINRRVTITKRRKYTL